MPFAGWLDAGVDATKPSIALGDAMTRLDPWIPAACRANRVFFRRAVRYIAAQGVRQFLDIGSGIPTVGNVSEIAGHARVVYVDRACEEARPMLPVLPHAAVAGCTTGGGRLLETDVIRETLTIAGRPERVSIARQFVGEVLGGQHPCADIAALLASELVTNSVKHSDSRLPGEVVTVAAVARDDAVRIEVTDKSGPTVPEPRETTDRMAEGGRGLQLVAMLSARWGYQRNGDRTTTWFECTA